MPDYAVLYVTRGEGEFESETTGRQIVGPGSVVFLFPNVWHRYRPRGVTGWTKYSVAFGGGYPNRLVRRKFLSPQTSVLDTGLDDTILRGFVRLLERVQSEPPGYPQLVAANTMEILAAALAAARHRQTGTTLELAIRQARHFLEEHAEHVVDAHKLAASVQMSYERFRHLFKEQTGLAPGQYHLQTRINRAKGLLRGTAHSIREIAAALNFEDPYHFSKIFKRHTGLSPSQWRGDEGEDLPQGPEKATG
jgi:AraC-like DNA-binding protein